MKGTGKIRKKEGNKPFIYQIISSIGAVIVSVIVLLDLHIIYLNKQKNGLIYSFTYLYYVQHLNQPQQQQHMDTRTN